MDIWNVAWQVYLALVAWWLIYFMALKFLGDRTNPKLLGQLFSGVSLILLGCVVYYFMNVLGHGFFRSFLYTIGILFCFGITLLAVVMVIDGIVERKKSPDPEDEGPA